MSDEDWESSVNWPPYVQPREEPAASDYRGLPCNRCGRPMHRVYTFADVGAFCSPGCRQKATEPSEKVSRDA